MMMPFLLADSQGDTWHHMARDRHECFIFFLLKASRIQSWELHPNRFLSNLNHFPKILSLNTIAKLNFHPHNTPHCGFNFSMGLREHKPHSNQSSQATQVHVSFRMGPGTGLFKEYCFLAQKRSEILTLIFRYRDVFPL